VNGTGREISRRLAGALTEVWADLVLAARVPDGLAPVRQEVRARGRAVHACFSDLTGPATLSDVAGEVVERLGSASDLIAGHAMLAVGGSTAR
jgi:NAD(P)-dependent dehydrogenase (short-subunit alcohol dehydrogenase family)